MELRLNQSPLGTFEINNSSASKKRVSPIVVAFSILSLFFAANFVISKLNIISCLCSACISACKSCGGSSSSGCGGGSSSSSSISRGCSSYQNEYATLIDDKGGTIQLYRTYTKSGCKKSSYGAWSVYNASGSSYQLFDTYTLAPKGYEVVGFYKDKGMTKSISVSDFKAKETYYVKYRELYVGESRTITFSTNLPSGREYQYYKIDSISIVYGAQVTDIPTVQDVEGYTFEGIFTEGGVMVFNSSLELQLEFKEAHYYNWDFNRLVARFKAEVYYIQVKYMSGARELDTFTVQKNYGQKFTYADLRTNTYASDSHVSIIAIYQDGVRIDLDPDQEHTLDVRNNFNITVELGESRFVRFHYNTDTLDDKTESYALNSLVNLPLMNQFRDAKPGYTPKGWSYRNDSYTTATIITEIENLSQDKDVYLIWEPRLYDLEYRSSLDNTLQGTGKYYGASPAQNLTIYDGEVLEDLDIQEFLSTRERAQGYEVRGLSLTKTPTSQSDYITKLPANLTERVTVYVIYQPITISISVYKAHGDLAVADRTQTLKYDEDINLKVPTYTSNPQYTFVGYKFVDKNNVERIITDAEGRYLSASYKSIKSLVQAGFLDFTEISTNGFNVQAAEADRYVNVTYYNGSTKLNPGDEYAKVKYGEYLTYAIEAQSGYEFKGWTLTQGSEMIYNSTVTEDLTVYAVFKAKNIQTTLLARAEGGYMEDVDVFTANKVINVEYNKQSGSIELPSALDTTKYTFKGYYYQPTSGDPVKVTNELGELLVVFKETSFGKTAQEFIADGITLYAVIEIRKFSVTYNVGSSSQTVNDIIWGTIAENKAIADKDGYTTKGWATEERTELNDFDNVKYNFTGGVTENTTLYAYYEPKTFIVTLIITEGSPAGTTYHTLSYGETHTFTVPTYTDPSKAFGGYKYGDRVVTNAQGVLNYSDLQAATFAEVEGGITLEETTTLRTFKVKYNVGDSEIGTQDVTYNQKAPKPTDPNPSTYNYGQGYIFRGWSKTKPTSDKHYYQITMFDFASENITEDVTLYAVFDNYYEIKFYDADKTTYRNHVYVKYGTNPQPIKGKPIYGNNFMGWFEMGTTQIVFEDDYAYKYSPYNITRDLELYAEVD